jgi:prepilin-type N-terminal cleavage/methylation domain-containing protein
MQNHAPRYADTRHGLTLVEVILVLALLVVIGAVSAPLLQGSFSRAGLHSAGDLLRGAWSKARLSAIQTGQTHVFRFEPGGSRFQTTSLNDLGLPASNDLPPADANAERRPADMLRLTTNSLPAGVVFSAGEVAPSPQVMALLPDAAGGPWSEPIVFHPDGTTSDASLLLANEHQSTIRVTLRGLTGISNTADAANEAAP